MAELESHDGVAVPTLQQSLDPFDIEWLAVVWDERICEASITQSTWTIPGAWTAINYASSAPATINGVSYASVNAVLVDINNAPTGRYEVSNQVVLSDGRQFERSFKISIKQL